MSRNTTSIVKAAMSALHYSGAGRVVAPVARGDGIIFMLHSVHPAPPGPFEPNRILRVTPAFLEAAIEEVRAAGYDIVSLDEVARRTTEGPGQRPFASFTLDDGYRDNHEFAYPVFKRMGVPFAIYVATDYVDAKGELWWLVLEETIKKVDHLEVTIGNHIRRHTTRTSAEKYAAFHAIYWALRALPEHELRATVKGLAARAGYDAASLCAELIMTWDEVRALAQDPLVTIGAHTCHHLALAKLSMSEARAEIRESVARIEAELGRPCRHFSYPYGDETSAGEREFALADEFGLLTAVTTRKGVIRRSHATRLTALPRASLNGDYQSRHCVRLLLTGAPFLLFGAARAARSVLSSITHRQAAPSI